MTTKRLIMHIGHPKTGSTTLQDALKAASKTLRKNGVFYPLIGADNNHKRLQPYLNALSGTETKSADSARNLGTPEESQSHWERIFTDMCAEDIETVILSYEGFYSALNSKRVQFSAPFLNEHFGEIDVCGYVRDPSGHFLSAAQQGTKHGRNFPVFPCSFRRNTLEAAAGAGFHRLVVRPFDRRELIGESIVTDFAHHCLPKELQTVVQDPPPSNTSISAEAMMLLQKLHRGDDSLPFDIAALAPLAPLPYRVIEAVDRHTPGQNRPVLLPQARQLAFDMADDLDWLADTHAIRFPNRPDRVHEPAAAQERLSRLTDVAQICPVDQDRYQLLCQNVHQVVRPRRNFFGRPKNPSLKARIAKYLPARNS
ncbi:hypothetical protein [Actibacterium ureilyticum]|uniref:hypothetical protein n=1 Tax=Actibacterium ureilyticum TaxID=1590614 RepID=UPI001140E72C|nr:hypothetical protein [Actibacterium ureilyticum]